MGNTQHSLLSGGVGGRAGGIGGKFHPDRGKTQSPFTSTRGLLTSKSPHSREDRMSDMSITPANKRYPDITQSALHKQKQIKSSVIQSKDGHPKTIQIVQTDSGCRSPTKLQPIQRLSHHEAKQLGEDKKKQEKVGECVTCPDFPGYVQFSSSTKSGAKRFTFDPCDIKVLKSTMPVQDVNQKSSPSPVEDCDIRIKVFYGSNRFVTVEWSSKSQNITCGWLISEIMRKLWDEDDYNKKTGIIGLKSMNPKVSECYDYLLTLLDSSLQFIKDGDSLQIIASPSEKAMVGSVASATSAFSPVNSDHNGVAGVGNPLSLEDFELIKVIGKGGFSKVFQVRKKDTGKIFAMKTLSKSKIKRDNKVENILNERAILERVAHPFIVQMKYAFQNEDFLFLILEFCAGGELFFRLNNVPKGRMTEKQAKFYFAEILEAISYLHANNILYRDLKPENIVLDENGHAKLTDFGLSKLNFKERDRAFSFCGSPEYMAPEMLATDRHRGSGGQPVYHNRAIDFYHLGALLFEILCGLPPFFSEDRQKMYRDIVFSPIDIPAFLSPECRALLRALLQKNPLKRLGCERGAAEIKEHPWCADIDWQKVMRKELEPPFKPFLHRSNFDPEYTSMEPILQDDEPLLTLEELHNGKPQEFLENYENRIAKQKTKNLQQHDQESKLSRQHSIELYGRENNTFRGYSFLQENIHQPTQNAFSDQDGYYFCLADSKEQSFMGLQSPICELDLLSDGAGAGDAVQLNREVSAFTAGRVGAPNEQELLAALLSPQSKNQQSQLSLNSEGIELMKANINIATSPNNTSNLQLKGKTLTALLQQQNQLAGQKVMQQQQSKESLYNELLSTFDYSVTKNKKELAYLRQKGVGTGAGATGAGTNVQINQTNSTMSLFSTNQASHLSHLEHNKGMSILSGGSGPSIVKQMRNHHQKDKSKDEKHSKEQLEFHKASRKYSPEIDLKGALMQVQQRSKLPQHEHPISINKHPPQSTTHLNPLRNSMQYNYNSEQISTRGNSYGKTLDTHGKLRHQNQQPNQSSTSQSEYQALGSAGMKNGKINKKRDSEQLSQGQMSPNSKSMIKITSSAFPTTKKLSQHKSHYNSVLKPSQPASQQRQSQVQQVPYQVTTQLKTSQLYNQVQGKVSTKKTRNNSNQQHQNQQPSQTQQAIPQYQQLPSMVEPLPEKIFSAEHDKSLSLLQDEELKLDSNFQPLQVHPRDLKPDSSAKFIVEQITANEFLGSFLTSGSNSQQVMISHSNGESTVFDVVASLNASGTGLEREQSFEEVSKEAMTALILNSSHESCCCSDDEFTSKLQATTTAQVAAPSKVSGTPLSAAQHRQSQRNLRRLQYNALQDSIQANQTKHKINNMEFKAQIERKLGNQDDVEEVKTSQPIHIEETGFYEMEEDKSYGIKNYKSSNPSVLGDPRPFHQSTCIKPEGDLFQSVTAAPYSMQKKLSSQPQGLAQPLMFKPSLVQGKAQQTGNNSLVTSTIGGSGGGGMHVQMNKTSPISPMRERTAVAGGSKLKERPIITPMGVTGGGIPTSANALLATPKSNRSCEGRSQQLLQNKLSHTVCRNQKKDGGASNNSISTMK